MGTAPLGVATLLIALGAMLGKLLADSGGTDKVVDTLLRLLAMVTFGTTVGFSASVLTRKTGNSLMPIIGVMLIVGAGGGFKQALVDGGPATPPPRSPLRPACRRSCSAGSSPC